MKVSGLPSASTPIAGTELLPLVQSSTLKNATVDNLMARLAIIPAGTTASAIQTAADLAVSLGKSLYIPGGNYDLGSTPININGPLHIFGDGRKTVLIRSVDVATAVFLANNQSNIFIENLAMQYTPGTTTVDGAHSAIHCIGCTGVLVRNVYAYGNFYVGISMENTSKAIVTQSEVRGPINRGLYAYLQSSDIQFIGNVVDGSVYGSTTKQTNYCININPGGTGTLDKIVVANNVVKNSVNQGISVAEQTRGALIIGNTVSDIGSNYGILVQNANGFSGGFTTVTGNNVKNCGQYGIYVTQSFYVSVTGNVCYNNTLDGINLSGGQNCSIVGNQSISNGGNGIYLSSSSNRNLITGNQCVSNTGRGLIIFDSSCTFNRYNDNYFYNNTAGTLTDTGTSSSAGTNLTS